MRDLQGKRKDSGQIKRLSLIRVPIRMTGESAFAEDLLYMISVYVPADRAAKRRICRDDVILW